MLQQNHGIIVCLFTGEITRRCGVEGTWMRPVDSCVQDRLTTIKDQVCLEPGNNSVANNPLFIYNFTYNV